MKPNEQRKAVKKQKNFGILWLSVGAAVFLAGLLLGNGRGGDYVSAAGFGFMGAGTLYLLRMCRLSRDPGYAEEYEASLTDERTVYVANKARSMTFFVSFYAQLVAGLLALWVFDQPRIGQALIGLTSVQGFLNVGLYWYYNKKY